MCRAPQGEGEGAQDSHSFAHCVCFLHMENFFVVVVTAKAAYGLISANLFLFVETDKVIRVSFACLLIKLRYFCLFQLTSRVTELVGMSFFRDMLLGVWEEGIHGFSDGMVASLDWHDTSC